MPSQISVRNQRIDDIWSLCRMTEPASGRLRRPLEYGGTQSGRGCLRTVGIPRRISALAKCLPTRSTGVARGRPRWGTARPRRQRANLARDADRSSVRLSRHSCRRTSSWKL
jgi:hypothetical protein